MKMMKTLSNLFSKVNVNSSTVIKLCRIMMMLKIKQRSSSTTNRKSFTPAPGTAATLPFITSAMAAKKKTYSSKIWSKTK